MKKKSSLVTFCALGAVAAMTISTACIAHGRIITLNKGPYLGASVGYGGSGKNPLTNSNRTLGLIYGVNGGYQFNKYFALEGGYVRLPNVTLDNSERTKNNSIIDIAAKGIIPLDSRVNIYGKLGVARVSTEYNAIDALNSHSTTGAKHRITPYYGVGIGINMSYHTAFTVEYDMTPKSGAVPATHALLAGFEFKF